MTLIFYFFVSLELNHYFIFHRVPRSSLQWIVGQHVIESTPRSSPNRLIADEIIVVCGITILHLQYYRQLLNICT